MSRKKITKKVEETVVNTTDEQTHVSSNAAIQYSAAVTISVQRNNKIVSTKTFHNNGHYPLFLFLAKCLTGRYNEVSNWTPRFIQLFHGGNKGDDFERVNLPVVFTTAMARSPKRVYGSSPSTAWNYSYDDNVDYATASFEFIIPFSYINTIDDVNVIALYCNNFSTDVDIDKPSCYFALTKKNITTGKEEWSTALIL